MAMKSLMRPAPVANVVDDSEHRVTILQRARDIAWQRGRTPDRGNVLLCSFLWMLNSRFIRLSTWPGFSLFQLVVIMTCIFARKASPCLRRALTAFSTAVAGGIEEEETEVFEFARGSFHTSRWAMGA